MIRKPAVAGQFYPHDGSEVRKQIKELTVESIKKEKVIAAVCPHAGYIYSGGVAGEVYSRIQLSKNIVIVGPNHTGIGVPSSVMTGGEWEMPTGNVKINSELANAIINNSKYLMSDFISHAREHSIEVQLPFIQYFIKDFTIVPIALMRSDYEICKDVGNAIYKGIKAIAKDTLIIASTDMTHFESHESAVERDKIAIDEILKLNPEGLYMAIKKNNISMCGFIPTTTTLIASKLLGAKECELVKYTTSGEVSGDYEHVVGYAGLLIK